MFRRLPYLLLFALLVSGCQSMKIENFEGTTPHLKIEEYFLGQTKAWGIFEDRFGNLKREFVVDIEGTWDGELLTLVEDFVYSDGETEQRIWRIKKLDEHTYEGRADDIIGVAVGKSYGKALNWSYEMVLNVGGGLRVTFDDWMYLQQDGVLINRATVSKFGLSIGEVTLFFRRVEEEAKATATESLDLETAA